MPCVKADLIFSLRIVEGWKLKTNFIFFFLFFFFAFFFFLFFFFYVRPFHGSGGKRLLVIIETEFETRPGLVGFAVAGLALGHDFPPSTFTQNRPIITINIRKKA
jgi:hypothetical protein